MGTKQRGIYTKNAFYSFLTVCYVNYDSESGRKGKRGTEEILKIVCICTPETDPR